MIAHEAVFLDFISAGMIIVGQALHPRTRNVRVRPRPWDREDLLKILIHAFCFVAVVIMAGCGRGPRMTQPDEQSEEFAAYLARNSAAIEFELQSQCSKDAKLWFEDDFSSDTDTMLMNFSDHYNKKQNKCFLLVKLDEDNSALRPGSWRSQIMLWDIHENVQYGDFIESYI